MLAIITHTPQRQRMWLHCFADQHFHAAKQRHLTDRIKTGYYLINQLVTTSDFILWLSEEILLLFELYFFTSKKFWHFFYFLRYPLLISNNNQWLISQRNTLASNCYKLFDSCQ